MRINGASVRSHRELLGLSQTACAERAKIERSHLANVEAGRRELSPEAAERLRVALKLKTLDSILADPQNVAS